MRSKSKNTFGKSAVLGALFFTFISWNSYAITPKTLTIFAEPNLSYALTEIAKTYSKESATIVSVQFGSASDLIDRIEDGEASDLFLSAHKTWIDNLKQKGLVDIYNINHVTDDTLTLITSADNISMPQALDTKNLDFYEALAILNKNRLDLLVDNNLSSLGQHSTYLIDYKKFNSIRLFRKLPEDQTPVLDVISKNNRIYGVVLGSQVSNRFKVISRLENRKIFYQALVVAGDNMDNAREFSNFLKSKKSQKIFRKNGFVGNYIH